MRRADGSGGSRCSAAKEQQRTPRPEGSAVLASVHDRPQETCGMGINKNLKSKLPTVFRWR